LLGISYTGFINIDAYFASSSDETWVTDDKSLDGKNRDPSGVRNRNHGRPKTGLEAIFDNAQMILGEMEERSTSLNTTDATGNISVFV